MSTQELTLKITGDPAVAVAAFRSVSNQAKASIAEVEKAAKAEAQAAITLQKQRSAAIVAEWKKEEREAARVAKSKLLEESKALRQSIAEATKAARQKVVEEAKAAKEIQRINAETTKQAEQQERLRERAAKQLADVQIREAKRAAKELEQNLNAQKQGGSGAAVLSGLSRVPGVGGAAGNLGALSEASEAAAASTAALAVPIGLAVAALVAEAAAAASVVEGLFELTRSTAEYQGALFDLSQQVGISVETLSGLGHLASTTGGNIDTVVGSLAIFQKHLEASHDPTSKEAHLLNELGVTATDTEGALRQAIKGLFDLGEGSKQTDASLQLFGKSGRFVNAILKESHGDLDAAIARFRQLGIIVSTEDAKAADEFNDSLTLLQAQVRGITNTIGKEAIPEILKSLKDLQEQVQKNKELFDALGFAARFAAASLTGQLKIAIGVVNAAIAPHLVEIRILVDLYERLAAAMQFVSGHVPNVDANGIPAQPIDDLRGGPKVGADIGIGGGILRQKRAGGGGGGRGGGGKSAAQQQAEQAQNFLNDLEEDLARVTNAYEGLDVASRSYAVQQAITNGVLAKASEALKDKARLSALNFDQITKDIKLQKELEDFQKRQNAQIKVALKGQQSFIDQADELIESLQKQGKVLSDTETFWLRFNAAILDSKKHLKDLGEELRDIAELTPAIGGGKGVPVPSGNLPINVGEPPPGAAGQSKSAIDQLFEAIRANTTGDKQTAALAGLEAIDDAFRSLGDAVGSVVESFVLYGSAGTSVRKVTAEILAGVAKQAAVKAVFELAEGFAALALAFFGLPNAGPSATAHFTAAAIYGGIAGIAAVAGRGVAGNAFSNASSASSGVGSKGSSGGSGSGSSGAPAAPTPIDVARPRIDVHVHTDDGNIVKVIQTNYRQNGEVHDMIHHALGEAGYKG